MNVRRPSLLLALAAAAAALALPGAASAQARRPTASGGTGTQLGLLVGFEDWGGDSGLALRLDGEFPWQALSPAVRLSFVGSAGYSHWSYNAGFFQTASSTLGIFKVTPALRFSFGNHPMIRPYVDGGLGVHFASFSIRARDPFTGAQFTDSRSDVSAHFRFAGGILFHLSPGFSLGGEVDLMPYFGDVDDTTFSLLFTAQFRL